MFDAVLNRHGRGPVRWGRGALLATGLHLVAFVALARMSFGGSRSLPPDPPEITFFAERPPPPPPPPPPAAAPVARGVVEEKRTVEKLTPAPRRERLVETKGDEPKSAPSREQEEDDPPPAPAPSGGDPEGREGGQPGGQAGGTPKGQPGGQPGGQVGGRGTAVLPFGEGMTRPSPFRPGEIQYTREAREARVSGSMIVKCIITTEGTLTRCRVIKTVPLMERAVLDALARHRGAPVTFQGRPVSVEYTFNIVLKMPD